MNCNQVDHLIMKYMDGILAMEEAHKLNLHITECDACREEFFTYQTMIEELQDFTVVEAPKEFEAQVMEKINMIEMEYIQKQAVSMENITAMVWGAFSLLFGIGVLLFIYRQSVLEYLIQSPYMGDWIQIMIPAVNMLSSYLNDIRKEVEDILYNGKEIIIYLKITLSSILGVLGVVKYYIYRKKKVEV